MNKITFLFLLSFTVLVFSCRNNKTGEEKKEGEKIEDTKAKEVVSDQKLLQGEWELEMVGEEPASVSGNVIFNSDGKVTFKYNHDLIEGTYTLNDKKIKIKTAQGEDNWDLKSVTADKLVVFDNNPKVKQNLTFSK
jgi:hypothetical protein